MGLLTPGTSVRPLRLPSPFKELTQSTLQSQTTSEISKAIENPKERPQEPETKSEGPREMSVEVPTPKDLSQRSGRIRKEPQRFGGAVLAGRELISDNISMRQYHTVFISGTKEKE